MATPHRRGPWSTQEDSVLMQLVKIHGPLNWVQISQTLTSRTPKQCRERYHQNLKPSLNHEPITAEEGAKIERLVNQHGKRWAEIARTLHGRSDNAVKNWWNGNQNRRRRVSRRRSEITEDTRHCPPHTQHTPRPSISPTLPFRPAAQHSRRSFPLPAPLNTSPYPYSQHTEQPRGGDLPLPSPSASESTESEYGSNYTISPVRTSMEGQRLQLPPLKALPHYQPTRNGSLPSLSDLAAAPATSAFVEPSPPPYMFGGSPRAALHPPLSRVPQPQVPIATMDRRAFQQQSYAPHEGYPPSYTLPTAPSSPESRMDGNYSRGNASQPSKDSRMTLSSLLAPTEQQHRH